MSRGIATLTTQLILLVRRHRIVETLEGTLTVIERLRLLTHRVGGGQTVHQQLVDLRGTLRTDLQSEGILPQPEEPGHVIPLRVGDGHGHTGTVLPLLLPPAVAHDIVGKLRTVEGRWCRHDIDQLGQLPQFKIRLHTLFLCVACHRARESQDGGEEISDILSHHLLVFVVAKIRKTIGIPKENPIYFSSCIV